MGCLQTNSRTTGSACPPPTAGLREDQIWLFNTSQVTFTGGTNKVYTGFTMAGSAVLYRYNVHNRGLDLNDELTVNEESGARSWATNLPFRILDRSGAAANDIETLGTELGVIIVGKNGKVMVGGSDAPMYLKENTSGFTAENFGENVTIGNDEGSKPYQLLMTDLPTTIAALIGAE